jgi:hypothetical protein
MACVCDAHLSQREIALGVRNQADNVAKMVTAMLDSHATGQMDMAASAMARSLSRVAPSRAWVDMPWTIAR